MIRSRQELLPTVYSKHKYSTITLSTSGAVSYRYNLFRYSLDRYGAACVHTCSGTVPLHLSTLQTVRNGTVQNERLIFGCGQVEQYCFRYHTDPKTLVWTGYNSMHHTPTCAGGERVRPAPVSPARGRGRPGQRVARVAREISRLPEEQAVISPYAVVGLAGVFTLYC